MRQPKDGKQDFYALAAGQIGREEPRPGLVSKEILGEYVSPLSLSLFFIPIFFLE